MRFTNKLLTGIALIHLFIWTIVMTLFPIWLIKILIEGLL